MVTHFMPMFLRENPASASSRCNTELYLKKARETAQVPLQTPEKLFEDEDTSGALGSRRLVATPRTPFALRKSLIGHLKRTTGKVARKSRRKGRNCGANAEIAERKTSVRIPPFFSNELNRCAADSSR
eukprot:scaffold578_cov243-Pinguiococcus_pyrenoidosus.AAC.13